MAVSEGVPALYGLILVKQASKNCNKIAVVFPLRIEGVCHAPFYSTTEHSRVTRLCCRR